MTIDGERTPAFKLLLAILVAAALAIPIFMTWFLVYDRQSQAQQATASITEGWGGPQAVSGPVLVIPYRATASDNDAASHGRATSCANCGWRPK